jgi:YD repeat-containing protein
VALALPVVALGSTITYQYDNLGRLRVVTQDSGNTTGYNYDAAGNRQSGTSTVPGTVQFAVSTYSVGENGGSIAVSVSRVGGSSGAASVQYQTANGTAIAGTNYTSTSGTLNWADADGAAKSFSVPILDDHRFDANTAFTITLSSATGATLGTQATASVTVTNTDAAQPGVLSLSPATYSILEASTSVTVTVARTGGSDGSISVQYATSGGTATAGSDYTSASGTLNWANGDTASKSFSVPILNDTIGEPTETIGLVLSNPSGSPAPTLGTSTGTISILDNEPGILQFTASTFSVGEAAGSAALTVSRTNGSYGAVTVAYSTANGTATSGSDYTAQSGTLSWATGDAANKTITVPIINDTIYEGNQTFTASLASPTGGATVGATNPTTVTIVDDDGPGIPTNIRTSPTGVALGGGFTVLWNTATGPVNHYTLQEVNQNSNTTTLYTIAAPTTSKGFSKGGAQNTFVYSARACSTTNEVTCSPYSATVMIDTCPASGCP